MFHREVACSTSHAASTARQLCKKKGALQPGWRPKRSHSSNFWRRVRIKKNPRPRNRNWGGGAFCLSANTARRHMTFVNID